MASGSPRSGPLRHLPADVDGFLALHDLTRANISTWVIHPGGPKVISSITTVPNSPGITRADVAFLGEIGNLSSSSVLHIVRDTIEKRPPSRSSGLMLAMGPGFCAELVLLRWH
ncbi:hypothetical protein [Mycobacterium riyadhense]|uniref:hypothetical protein n=1 Tax=Mycobacterium riyadhense TaxID=486698 RepID=UPI00195E8C7C